MKAGDFVKFRHPHLEGPGMHGPIRPGTIAKLEENDEWVTVISRNRPYLVKKPWIRIIDKEEYWKLMKEKKDA